MNGEILLDWKEIIEIIAWLVILVFVLIGILIQIFGAI